MIQLIQDWLQAVPKFLARKAYKRGRKKGYADGHKKGCDEGYEKGFAEGHKKGFNEGYNKSSEDAGVHGIRSDGTLR